MSMCVPKLRFKEFSGMWQAKKIKEITSYVDYRGKTPEKSDSGIFLVTAKNIRLGYIDYESSKEYIPAETYEDVMRRGKPIIGDVLITTEAPLGNVASVDREDIALAQRVIKLRGIPDLLQNTYLKFCLLSEGFQKQILEKATGGTVKGIKGSVLHKINLTFPSLSEQTKIANFLTAIDEKITQLTQKCDLLAQYKKGVMQQIFSQKLRFKDDDGREFPEWEEKELRDLCNLITKGTTPTSIGHEFKTTGINFIKIESLEADGKLIKEKLGFIDSDAHAKLLRSQLKLNDILFSIAGALGRVAIVTNEFLPANTNQALAIIRLGNEQSLNTKL